MNDQTPSQPEQQQLATALAAHDWAGIRHLLSALLAAPNTAEHLCAFDAAGLLTQLLPELEPARATQQPSAHFLPVLAHSLETVAAVDWLLSELQEPATSREDRDLRGALVALPVAVQTHPELRFHSVYAPQLRERLAGRSDDGHTWAALFTFAALLHDNAKPQTRQIKPDGGVSFYNHSELGAVAAYAIAQRLGFSQQETDYISLIIREHMRPGQLGSTSNVTLRAARRFFRDTGAAGPDVLLHALADHLATRGPRLDVAGWYTHVRWTDTFLDEVWGEEVPITPPLLDGAQLMATFGLAPGPLVGRILATVGEAQVSGDITTRDEALAIARRIIRNRHA